MKKTAVAALAFAAVALVLTGCNSAKKKKKSKTPVGPEPSEAAWVYAFNNAIHIGPNVASFEVANDVKPEDKTPTPFISLMKSATVRPMGEVEDYAFEFEYKYSVTVSGEEKNTEDYIEDEIYSEAMSTSALQFKNWPANGSDDSTWPRFVVETTAKCNGHSQTKSYTMVLNPTFYEFRKMTLADIYAKHPTLDCLACLKADTTAGSYKADCADEDFYNVETQGKLVYATEDGNWGVLQDGDKFIQIYQLSMAPIWDIIKDKLIGNNIWLKASVSPAYGNIQMSYVKSMLPIKSGDTAHPVISGGEKNLTEADLSNLNWWTNPIFNAIGSVSGATVADGKIYEIKNASGGSSTTETEVTDKSKIKSESSRYEFNIKIGSLTMRYATDYHACCGYDGKGASTEFSAQMNEWLKGLTTGASIKVQGTVRWLNTRSVVSGNDYTIRTSGAWTITPFLSSHIA